MMKYSFDFLQADRPAVVKRPAVGELTVNPTWSVSHE
jgi:hypothetical protein